MGKNLKIAFDIKEGKEYLIKYKKKLYTGELTKHKRKSYYIFEKQEPIPQNIGTFLIDFLNTNFVDKESCRCFIFEYLFVNLLFQIKEDIHINSEIHKKNISYIHIEDEPLNVILSEKEIEYYYDKIYYTFRNELLYFHNIYSDICDLTFFKEKSNLYLERCGEDSIFVKYLNNIGAEAYMTASLGISKETNTLKINFYLEPFYTIQNRKYIKQNLPYYFFSEYFDDILFISFREFAYTRKNVLIKRCSNCSKYFIPLTAHVTKYCDSLFDGKKTCKQIGIEKSYIESLENNRLLKKYRYRYQALSKLVATTNKNTKSLQMYEYYKKRGPAMLKKYKTGIISSEEFEEWIDSTKLR